MSHNLASFAMSTFCCFCFSVTAASAVPLSLEVAPGSSVNTTIDVATVFGSDTDGPTPVVVTGTASADLQTAVDPVHGMVATSIAFTASDLRFADTDFQVTVFVPIDISLIGIRGMLTGAPLGPGLGVSAGTAEFDVAPLDVVWTEGEVLVLDPPGIPAAGTTFPLAGTGTVLISPNGSSFDVIVTLPLVSMDSATDSDVTVTTSLDGTLILMGSFAPAPVPALSNLMMAALAITVAGFGLHHRRRSLIAVSAR